MNTEQLHEVLDRAAGPVPRPDFATEALSRASTVRRRRAAGRASLAAVAMVGGISAGVMWGARDSAAPPAVPPTSTVTTPTTDEPTAPPIDESVVQPRWDPRGVASLPVVDVGLPASLQPPSDVSGLTGIDGALALVDDGQRLSAVDGSGRWLSLPYPEVSLDRYGDPAVLTVDGSRIVFTGRTALWWRFVDRGGWQRLAYPEDFTTQPDWGGGQMVSDRADGLWLGDPRQPRTWYVDLTSGIVEEQAGALDTATWAGDRGLVRIGIGQAPIRHLSIGTPGEDEERWRVDDLYSLTHPASDGRSLAAARSVGGWSGSRGPTEQNGLIALSLSDLSTRAYLPFPDPSYWYTDAGAMQPLHWLDTDTLVVSVIPQDTGGETGTRYLFTWDVETGELRLASELPARLGLSVSREWVG